MGGERIVQSIIRNPRWLINNCLLNNGVCPSCNGFHHPHIKTHSNKTLSCFIFFVVDGRDADIIISRSPKSTGVAHLFCANQGILTNWVNSHLVLDLYIFLQWVTCTKKLCSKVLVPYTFLWYDICTSQNYYCLSNVVSIVIVSQ